MFDYIQIELEALVTEREMMVAMNKEREFKGEAPAYGEEHFFDLSNRIRNLHEIAKQIRDTTKMNMEKRR